MCASGHRALSSRTRSQSGVQSSLFPASSPCYRSAWHPLTSPRGSGSRSSPVLTAPALPAPAQPPPAVPAPPTLLRTAGQGPRGGRAARRGGAAAGNNAAYPAAPRAGRKGQHALSCSAASLAPSTTRHRACPSQLRAPETRKPPPSTQLLAPEAPRARTTTEGDGNCCWAKMSPAVLVERGSEGEAPRSLPSRSPLSTKKPLRQSPGHPSLRSRMNTPHSFVGTHAPSSHTHTDLRAPARSAPQESLPGAMSSARGAPWRSRAF